MKQLLTYMEHTTKENAVNPSLQKIHGWVDAVKRDKEVSLLYMKIFESEQMLIEQGIERGIEQGIEQGIKRGIEQGIGLGIERGILQGIEQEQINTERERKRAETAEASLRLLQAELNELKRKF